MQQVQLPLDVNGNAHVAYVQSRSIGGQGDDVSVLDSVPLCRSRLFHTLPFGLRSPENFSTICRVPDAYSCTRATVFV